MPIFSFAPIADNKSKILILGTMPGKDSLRFQQYYAHPRNAFWKIMFTLLKTPAHNDYENKKQLLLSNHIALWDVLKACERRSSADSDILLEEPNDFATFFDNHPSIQHIFFNGNNPLAYYLRHLEKVPHPYTVLPSTSPAHVVSFEKKLENWAVIARHL